MGSRGAFVDVNKGNFTFKDGGQNYLTLMELSNGIKFLIQQTGAVKIPDYSHGNDRIYAVIQKGEIKSIGIYKDHKKIVSIDLKHTHKNKDGVLLHEHYHTDLYHKDEARALTPEYIELVKRVQSAYRKAIK